MIQRRVILPSLLPTSATTVTDPAHTNSFIPAPLQQIPQLHRVQNTSGSRTAPFPLPVIDAKRKHLPTVILNDHQCPQSDLQGSRSPNAPPFPLPQPIFHQSHIPLPEITVHISKDHETSTPKPASTGTPGEHEIRCVCGKPHRDVQVVIQCQMCRYWFHGLCVNVARETKNDPFICPFCLHRRIRCRCGKSEKYDEPIIQCTNCKFWSHKSCESLDYGRNPTNFVCHVCDSREKVYELPFLSFDSSIPDSTTFTDIDKEDLVRSVPDGLLKQMLVDDLSKGQLSFRETVSRYFRVFAGLLFDRVHEFWRMFVASLCVLLKCERSFLLNAIDQLAMNVLYAKSVTMVVESVEWGRSESIREYVERQFIQRLEKVPQSVKLLRKSDEPGIRTAEALDDGAFICEVNGFLEHTDEVRCENGIPRSCVLVTDLDLVVDTEGTPMSFLKAIRRSFHFNCIVKLVRINGEIKAALYATKTTGPLNDEKSRRGHAIVEGGELFLPFDGEIPFPIRKVEWKEKKNRGRQAPPVKPKGGAKIRKKNSTVEVANPLPHITLLSGFLSDKIPTMPFVVLPDNESASLYQTLKNQTNRNKENVS